MKRCICIQAEEDRDAAVKLAEAGGAGGPGRAARVSQLEDQLNTGAQREGVLQSQLTDALQQCADQVCNAACAVGTSSQQHCASTPVLNAAEYETQTSSDR